MPCCESSSTTRPAPRCACSRSTSNSSQTLPATISDSGVRPSAACQIVEATSLSVKNVESAADITIISPPSMRAAIALLRAMYFSGIMTLLGRSKTTNLWRLTYYVPHSPVGGEYQAVDGNQTCKLARRLKNQLHQLWINGEKQNVPQQPMDGLGGADRFDPVFWTLLEQKECAQGSKAVLADPGQLSCKRRSTSHVAIAVAPHVGDFVGEQRRIGGRQAGHRRLARAGNSGKQKSSSPAKRACGMNQKAPLPGQGETVNDAQNAINGVRIARLTDMPVAGFRIPARAEVTPL